MRVCIYIYMYKCRCSPRFAFMRLKWQHSVATVSPTQSMRCRPLILQWGFTLVKCKLRPPGGP